MENGELRLISTYYRIVRFWWIVALASILGGGLGWILSKFQPPIYDAKASLVVTVDFEQTGNISPFNLDHAVGSIQLVFFSNDVLSSVISEGLNGLNQADPEIGFDQFVMERYSETWVLRVRHTNPETATKLVNLWQKIGYDALIRARERAVTARLLQQYLDILENCPSAPAVSPPIPPICQDGNILDPDSLDEIQARIRQELAESHAIRPYLLISLNDPAEIPQEPIQYQVKWMVLGGMLAFFVLAILILQFVSAREQIDQ